MMDAGSRLGGLARFAVVGRPSMGPGARVNAMAPRSIVVETPGDASRETTVVFEYLGRFARYRSEMGLFRVDDARGSVDGLLPGTRGYHQAALRPERRITLFERGDGPGTVAEATLPGGGFYGVYLMPNGSSAAWDRAMYQPGGRRFRGRIIPPLVSFPAANPGRFANLRALRSGAFGWEDLPRGGDRDFNDLIFRWRSSLVEPPVDAAPTVTIVQPTSGTLVNAAPIIAGMAADDHRVASIRAEVSSGVGATKRFDVAFDPATGAFSFPSGALADGAYRVRVIARDDAGQDSAPAETTFILDATPPLVSLQLAPESDTGVVGDGRTHLGVVRLIGWTEPNAIVTLTATGWTGRAGSDGFFAFDGVPLPAYSTYEHAVTAMDPAGNIGAAVLSITRVAEHETGGGDDDDNDDHCGFDSLDGWKVDVAAGTGTATIQDRRVVLREGTSFEVALSRTFLVPENPTALSFTFEDPVFDATDPSFINDAFEVALLGENGVSLVPTFTAGRDAFFNITEGLPASTGSGVAITGSTATLDVSGLTPGSEATLVFRLVNNDSDTETSVAIVCATGLPEMIEPRIGSPTVGSLSATGFVSAATVGSSQLGTWMGSVADSAATGLRVAALAEGGTPSQSDIGDSLINASGRAYYTSSEDFLLGTLSGVDVENVPGELRLNFAGTTRTGTWTEIVDAGRNGAPWAAIALDAEAPRNTQIRLLARAGDNRDALGELVWTDVSPGASLWDLSGRYLDVKLELRSSTADGTPIVRSIEIVSVPWPTVEVTAPVDKTQFPAGESLVISGLATPSQPQWTSVAPLAESARHLVDFEAGAGFDLVEGMTIGDQYLLTQGMDFLLEGGGRPILAKVGEPQIAFEGPGGLPDQPVAGTGTGSFFLTTADNPGGRPDPLIVWYAEPVSEAAGDILDIDTAATAFTVFESNGTAGYYNESIGTLLNGTSYLFPTGSDPTINNAPEPDLSPASAILGDWLIPGAPPQNGYWNFRSIPSSWPINTETAIVYEIDGGPGGVQNLLGSFGVDNGIFIWLNGEYKFGALAPGGVGIYEYPNIPLGNLAPGKNYLQILREDHGSTNGFAVRITGELIPADSWLVEARDSSGAVLETQTVGPDAPGAGDGGAARWSFERWDADIASVRISYTGTMSGAPDFAFDNFTTVTPGLNTPHAVNGRSPNLITNVTVNGQPVDALDGAGRFFAKVDVKAGENVYEVVATDLYGQSAATTVMVEGVQGGGVDFSTLSDVSASFDVDYARTSFRRGESTLYADVAVKNVGRYAVATPLYVAIANISAARASALDADGYTPDGLPYYDVSGLIAGGRLEPGRAADPFAFAFWNPDAVQFTYDLVFFGLLNRAPVVTSVPTVEAGVGRSYRYQAVATDPDGDPVSFHLTIAPAGMTIDEKTGLISWSPTEADLGSHTVVVHVDDGRGGTTDQTFDVSAMIPPPNRPPIFTSLPTLDAYVGLPYAYDADAFDADGDALTFTIVSAPEGVSIHPETGLVSWTPLASQRGDAHIILQVADNQGGTALQPFTLCVAQAPGNHAPVIVSQPVTTFVVEGQETAQTFDLGRWQAIDFPNTFGDGDGPDVVGRWLIDPTGTSVEQRVNASATMLLSDQILENTRIEGSWRVADTGLAGFVDNDFIGFVFGYQDSQDFYLFDWRQGTESYQSAVGLVGMTVKRITANSPLVLPDFWDSQGTEDRVTALYHNSIPWVNHTEYHFALEARPGQFTITVSQAGEVLDSVTIEDDAFDAGRFGFYNYSQGQVHYSGFTRQSLITADYAYQVVGIDPDGDALTYSLVSGPQGMTINPATGEIEWRTSNGVDEASVTVRVDDGRGGVDEQSFTLTAGAGEIHGTVRDTGSPWVVASSTFDTGLDGWTSAAPQNISWRESDGNPGGQLYFADRTYRHPVVSAPAEFLGDWSSLNGTGRIEYDQTLTYDGGRGGPYTFIPYQVFLSGPGGAASWTGGTPTGLTPWTTITAPLVESEWVVGQGTWAELLRNVTSFQIRVELVGNSDSGFDQSGLDNVRVIGGAGVGLGGWTVYIDQNQNARLDPGESSTVTDSTGNYSFAELSPGAYYVRELVQPGWTRTHPSGSGVHIVTIGGNEVIAGIDFGNHPSGEGSTDSLNIASAAPDAARAGVLLRYDPIIAGSYEGSLTFDLPVAPAGMTVHPTLGVLVWTPTVDQVGAHQVVLRARDGAGGFALQTFEVVVPALNAAPVVVSTPPGPATVGNPYEYLIRAQDADGDPLTFQFVSPVGAGITVDAAGALRFTPAAGRVGSLPVVVRVDDGRGGALDYAFSIAVAASAANSAPTIRSTAPATARQGAPYSYLVDAVDPDGDPLAFELLRGPDGMTLGTSIGLDGSTIAAPGLIRWTPTAADIGQSREVEVRVSDGRGGSAVQSFTIQALALGANAAPRITSNPGAAATVDWDYRLDMKAVDPDGDPILWSLATAPRGMSIDPARGTIFWRPVYGQMGTAEVVVEARDPFGATAVQRFTIIVSCDNQDPAITSTPITRGWAGDPYLYAVRADDPEGDPLTFELLAGPAGMSIDAAGVIRWNPVGGGQAAVAVQVSDGRGGSAVQSFGVVVSETPRNRSPFFTSSPVVRATPGAAYAYKATGIDPEGEPLRFELLSGPAGMTIGEDAGLLSWTPVAGDEGSRIVTIAVLDPLGAKAVQTFALEVRANGAPTIVSSPITGSSAGSLYRYDVRAVDPDGDALTHALAVAPAGMTIDGNGRIMWKVPTNQPTNQPIPITVVVRDPLGAEAVQTFSITVRPDDQAPKVSLGYSTNLANTGDVVRFQVYATDDVGVVSTALTVGGQAVALDAEGRAVYNALTPGVHQAIATAVDAAGNVGTSAPFELRVFDANDKDLPVVQIISPSPLRMDHEVTYLTEIVGSVSDDNLEFWRLHYARADLIDLDQIVNVADPDQDDPDWVWIADGTENVSDAMLGVFDPTTLMNGTYVVRLMARDVNGLIQSQGVLLNVTGAAKIGNFHLEFTDLQVPLAGIPITVNRVYDTLNAADEGDFGFGWRLGLVDAQILETAAIGEAGAFNAGQQTLIPGVSKVYLTNPEGRRVGFTYNEQLTSASFFGGIWRPYFTPDPGVYDTLTIDETQVARGGIIGALVQGINPDVYTLTTQDGVKYRYDQFDGLKTITDLNGNVLTVTSAGVFHSSGVSITYERDHRGRIVSITQRDVDGNPVGESIRYAYDAIVYDPSSTGPQRWISKGGDLKTVTLQGGLTTRYAYLVAPNAHFLDEAFDPNGARALKVVYENNRFVRIVDAQGNTVDQRDYDLEARTAVIRDANGNAKTLVYDDRGNVLTETDALGGVTRYEYGDARNPDLETKVVDAAGNVTLRQYDARGNVTRIQETGPESAPLADPVTTTFSYDTRGNVTSITNDFGRATTFVYDAGGNLTKLTNAAGDVSGFTYDSQGRRASFTDFNGNTTLFEYKSEDCGCGSPRKITYADGSYQMFEFNGFGQVVAEATFEADGSLVEFVGTVYDSLGREIQTIRGVGADRIVTRKVYKGMNLDYEMVVNPASPNETRDTPVAQRQSRITAYDYDAKGQFIRQINPDGGVIEFRYDPQGNRVLLMDPVGNVTTWAYDALNRVAEERDPFYWRAYTEGKKPTEINIDAILAANKLPSGADADANRGAAHVTVYDHDAVGNQTEIIDRNGRRLEFSYDHAGRVTEERWYAAVTDELVRTMTWRYDALGNLLEAGDPDSHYTYAYDTLNRVTSVDNAGTPGAPRVVLTYEYDKQGNVVSTSDDSGVTVASEYDSRNRLSVRKWYDAELLAGENADVDPIRIDFSHNAAGRETLLERFSGLDRSTSAGRTVTTYYQTGQVDKITHVDALDELLASYDYGYDFGGLVVTEDRDHQDPQYRQTIEYAYDLNGQLIKADYDTQPDEEFVYDLNGNRKLWRNGAQVISYGAPGLANQLTSDSQFTYEYDGQGNLIRKTETATGNVTSYAYDHRNRLVSVEERSAGGIILSESRYAYDVDGQRIVQRINGDALWTAYNGANAWGDFTATSVEKRYFFGKGIDENLAQQHGAESAVLYLTDLLGSVRDLANAAGEIIDHIEFNVFGNVLNPSKLTVGDRFLFTGREFNPRSGLHFYRARYYDPGSGRFINRDPIGFDGREFNAYQYTKNSPPNYADPSGKIPIVAYVLLTAAITTQIIIPLEITVRSELEAQGISHLEYEKCLIGGLVPLIGSAFFGFVPSLVIIPFIQIGCYLSAAHR